MASDSSDITNNKIFIITLSTVLPVVGLVVIFSTLWLCLRKKRLPLFNRGITPIGDDEIATWKNGRGANNRNSHYDGNNSGSEKDSNRYTTRPASNSSSRHHMTTATTNAHPHHSPNNSTSTHKKAPSLIQYQSNSGRPSTDAGAAAMAAYSTSPKSFGLADTRCSIDLPTIPSSNAAVLARAPNARSGLTDETVPGDVPFLPSPRRTPSKRLQKSPPTEHSYQAGAQSHRRFQPSLHSLNTNNSPPRRSRGSRTSSMKSHHEAMPTAWQNGGGYGSSSPTKATNGGVVVDESYNTSPTSTDVSNGLGHYGPGSPRQGHARACSNSSSHHRAMLAYAEGDDEHYTILSPPPPTARRPEDIGRAIG